MVLTIPISLLSLKSSNSLDEKPQEAIRAQAETEKYDPREEILSRWFTKYKCPLASYTQLFIAVSDQYSLDYRLLPAISFKESTCGKRELSFNSFGFGYYKFDSFTHAITYVAGAISGSETKDKKHYQKANRDSYKILRIYNKRQGYANEALKIMEEIK